MQMPLVNAKNCINKEKRRFIEEIEVEMKGTRHE